jgi:hypothetical protein
VLPGRRFPLKKSFSRSPSAYEFSTLIRHYGIQQFKAPCGPTRISLILAQLPGLMIFKAYDVALSWKGMSSLIFAISWSLLIFMVLTMILVPFGQIVAGLLGSLALSYLLPVRGFREYSYGIGGLMAPLIMTLPIFFAGILFADAFVNSPSPSYALGWNILGAMLGGLTESFSFLFGIPSLILFAAGFYSLALVWPQRSIRENLQSGAISV